MASLTIRNLYKSFGPVQVLRGVNLEAQPGEFIALVGPSGCGKSTLLAMIAGLESISSGEIFIGDRLVNQMPPKDRDIAMVFQSYALYPTMSVQENITFGMESRNIPRDIQAQALARVAQLLQIEPLLKRKPAQLSGGQRQRVAMGRALARDPKLFLFDEPLSNLDAKLRVEMRAEIKLLHQRTQVTTVYVTHDQIEAMTLGDRIAVMRGGHIEQFDAPEAIYGRPATRFVAEFIGSPAMNFMSAEWRGDSVVSGDIMLAVTEAQRAALQAAGAGKLLYGVRPEALSLSSHGLPGSIKMVEPTGPDTYALIDTALGTLCARVPGHLAQRAGEHVLVTWPASSCHLFDAASENRVG